MIEMGFDQIIHVTSQCVAMVVFVPLFRILQMFHLHAPVQVSILGNIVKYQLRYK